MDPPAPGEGRVPSIDRPRQEVPRVFRLSAREANDIHRSPTGDVGHLFSGEGIELVWVSKQDEQVDAHWFDSDSVVLLVLSGELRVECESATFPPMTLAPLDLLILPAKVRCRAYRWPRSAVAPTLFLAAYPAPAPRG
jgi:hypothetical protein